MKHLRAGVAAAASVVSLLLLLPVVLLGLPFIAVSYVTRAFCRRFERSCVPWQKIIQFDPVVGWKPKPNLDLQCSFSRGVFHLETDAKGWRGHDAFENTQMLVIGDSFAFGYGVDDKHAFFSLNHSELRIKAIGSPGYNMAQEVIWMRQLSAQLKGKIVVWFVCFSNDLYDNLLPNLTTYRMPFARRTNGTGSWQIESGHLSQASWPCRYEYGFRVEEKFCAVFGNNAMSERVYSACEFLIEAARDICRDAGAELTIVTIPWSVQLTEEEWHARLRQLREMESYDRFLPDRKFAEITSRLGVPLICSREHLDVGDYIPIDGHWNEKGHRRIASLLNGVYRQHAGHMQPGAVGAALQRSPSQEPPVCISAS